VIEPTDTLLVHVPQIPEADVFKSGMRCDDT